MGNEREREKRERERERERVKRERKGEEQSERNSALARRERTALRSAAEYFDHRGSLLTRTPPL